MTATARPLIVAHSAGRLLFGVGLAALPGRLTKGWIGRDARRSPVQAVIRGLGARDAALSTATLGVLARDGDVRPWLAAAIASDLSDVLGVFLARERDLPANARWGTVALGGGWALFGAVLFAVQRGAASPSGER